MQRSRRLERELYRLMRARDGEDVDYDDTEVLELQATLDDTKEQVRTLLIFMR